MFHQRTENSMANKYKLTKAEQETVIGCSAADSEWNVCTADPLKG